MKLLDLSFDSTAENLAADEILLDWSDSSQAADEVFRMWENPTIAVILGRSSRHFREVNVDWCRSQNVPIFRRASGGAAVVIGPGCLMYSIVMSYDRRPGLRMLDRAHQFVMLKMQAALRKLDLNVEFQGICDLTLDNRKISGNSLRCKRNSLLYHGTLLYDFSTDVMSAALGQPPRTPEYRRNRSHNDFVTNLDSDSDSLRSALRAGWNLGESLNDWPRDRVSAIAKSKYENTDWTFSR